MHYSGSSNFNVEVKLRRIPPKLILYQWQKAEKCALYSKFFVFDMFPVKIAIVSFIICLKDSTHPMETRFLLADNLYCKASVPPTDKVCLWLGVSKMELFLRLFQ